MYGNDCPKCGSSINHYGECACQPFNPNVDPECTDDDEPDPELECTCCGGEGRQEGNLLEEPVDRWGEVPCKACGGSGLRKDQTIW